MIELVNKPVVIADGKILDDQAAAAVDAQKARKASIAASILDSHNKSGKDDYLQISFDSLASHDITYVGIIQTAIASGLKQFPVPYVLTNCHNSLCAIGGTINEDDHVFGLSAARKYGGIFVPPHLAVIHQYMREMMAACGGMIMGSDSHTRYGALGVLGVGEGGPEIVKQLLGKTWDLPRPEVVAVWLDGSPKPGVGPQDVALAIIGAVFKNGFVKNSIMEFMGPGIASLSMDYRFGIDVMTTETACLSSIWPTDETTRNWLALHNREKDYRKLEAGSPACYDRLIRIDLSSIEPMIALPYHPGNVYTIREFNANAEELLANVEEESVRLFGKTAETLKLRDKIKNGAVVADQGIIAGCAGGTFENISYAAVILQDWSLPNQAFTFAVYPASVPQASALINNGSVERLMSLGAIVKTAFCGPCFGAGDTPAAGALSIRHTTRNFPNREGSKPQEGQLSAVALMDARSIAASAANGGKITPATELDWDSPDLRPNLKYHFNGSAYKSRVYNGFGHPMPDQEIISGPNIAAWPHFEPLPEHLLLQVASVITDPVTTTDELIPSGETSSLRSNPEKLSQFTLSRKDPAYVGRAKAMRELERKRLQNVADPELLQLVKTVIGKCAAQPEATGILEAKQPLAETGLGSIIFAIKPGDGSAREQAASCQKVLGGWGNIAVEYATKRYRTNLINWGMIPFIAPEEISRDLKPGDYLVIPNIRSAISNGNPEVLACLVHEADENDKVWAEQISLSIQSLDKQEREIILAGCLINFNSPENKQ